MCYVKTAQRRFYHNICQSRRLSPPPYCAAPPEVCSWHVWKQLLKHLSVLKHDSSQLHLRTFAVCLSCARAPEPSNPSSVSVFDYLRCEPRNMKKKMRDEVIFGCISPENPVFIFLECSVASLQWRYLQCDRSPSQQPGMCGICVRGLNGGSSCGEESAGEAGWDTCPQ